jgi:protein ImuA
MRNQGVVPVAAPLEGATLPVARLRAVLERLARTRIDLSPLPLGSEEPDRVLGGGLMRGALHEVAPVAEGDATSAAGFCAGILARALSLEKQKPVLWVRHPFATLEDGAPYGPGLAAFGLDPARLLFVLAANRKEVCEAMEQALRSGTLLAVLGELRGTAKLDLRASRRMSLAASHGGTLAIFLRLGAGRQLRAPISAATRWRIGTLASGEAPANGLGAPRFAAELLRNRRGPVAGFSLEWRTHDRTFLDITALCQPVAAAAFDRPHSAPAQTKRRASA